MSYSRDRKFEGTSRLIRSGRAFTLSPLILTVLASLWYPASRAVRIDPACSLRISNEAPFSHGAVKKSQRAELAPQRLDNHDRSRDCEGAVGHTAIIESEVHAADVRRPSLPREGAVGHTAIIGSELHSPDARRTPLPHTVAAPIGMMRTKRGFISQSLAVAALIRAATARECSSSLSQFPGL